MIKWIRGKLYHGFGKKRTGYMFAYGDQVIVFERFANDSYPPFDCLNLTRKDAVKLCNFLMNALDDSKNEQP